MLMLKIAKMMLRNQKGQGMVEYGLILALVAVVVAAGFTLMQVGLTGLLARVTTAL